jgi:hypothetical protein
MLNENFHLEKKNRHFDSYDYYFNVIGDLELTEELNDSIEYFSFYKGKIIKNKGSYIGKLLHGKIVKVREDGKIAEQGSFFQGAKDKQWKFWNKKGELYCVESWNKGQKHGKFWRKDSSGCIHKKIYDDHFIVEEHLIFSDSLHIEKKYKRGVLVETDTLRSFQKIVKSKTKEIKIERKDTLIKK